MPTLARPRLRLTVTTQVQLTSLAANKRRERMSPHDNMRRPLVVSISTSRHWRTGRGHPTGETIKWPASALERFYVHVSKMYSPANASSPVAGAGSGGRPASSPAAAELASGRPAHLWLTGARRPDDSSAGSSRRITSAGLGRTCAGRAASIGRSSAGCRMLIQFYCTSGEYRLIACN